jgi:hypothetical protein
VIDYFYFGLQKLKALLPVTFFWPKTQFQVFFLAASTHLVSLRNQNFSNALQSAA